MAASSRLLPNTRPDLTMVPWCIVLGLVTFVLCSVLFSIMLSDEPLLGVVVGLVYGLIFWLIGFTDVWRWYIHHVCYSRELSSLAHRLGLEYEDGVSVDDLEPMKRFLLFRLTSRYWKKAGLMLRGRFPDRQLVVLEFGYQGGQRRDRGKKVSIVGKQTIAFLPEGDGLPDFHLAPGKSDWNRLVPHWRGMAGPAEIIVFDEDRGDEVVIRGPDDQALLRLFTPERLGRLSPLAGWTIECQEGRLLVYRHREVVDLSSLPHFLNHVVHIARVLTA